MSIFLTPCACAGGVITFCVSLCYRSSCFIVKLLYNRTGMVQCTQYDNWKDLKSWILLKLFHSKVTAWFVLTSSHLCPFSTFVINIDCYKYYMTCNPRGNVVELCKHNALHCDVFVQPYSKWLSFYVQEYSWYMQRFTTGLQLKRLCYRDMALFVAPEFGGTCLWPPAAVPISSRVVHAL